MSTRPTDEVIQYAEWLDVGRCGCLLPDDEVTQGDCGDEENDE